MDLVQKVWKAVENYIAKATELIIHVKSLESSVAELTKRVESLEVVTAMSPLPDDDNGKLHDHADVKRELLGESPTPEPKQEQAKEPEWRDPIPGIDEGNPTAQFRDTLDQEWHCYQGSWKGICDGKHVTSTDIYTWNFARVRDHGKHVAPSKPKQGEWVTPVKGRDEGKVCRAAIANSVTPEFVREDNLTWLGSINFNGKQIHLASIRGQFPCIATFAEVRAE